MNSGTGTLTREASSYVQNEMLMVGDVVLVEGRRCYRVLSDHNMAQRGQRRKEKKWRRETGGKRQNQGQFDWEEEVAEEL